MRAQADGCTPSPKPPNSPGRANRSAGDTLHDLVAHYVCEYRPQRAIERAYYAGLKSVTDAVRIAALSTTPDGKRHPHQRRIPGASLAEASLRLGEAGLERAQSFDELHELITRACAGIDRFGELTRYDVACRIGARLGRVPERVYLHAGTRKGARALGLPHRGATLDVNELPVALGPLHPGEVEDFLCIYKDDLPRR